MSHALRHPSNYFTSPFGFGAPDASRQLQQLQIRQPLKLANSDSRVLEPASGATPVP